MLVDGASGDMWMRMGLNAVRDREGRMDQEGGGREDLLIPHLSCGYDAIQPLRYRMISCFHVEFVAQ